MSTRDREHWMDSLIQANAETGDEFFQSWFLVLLHKLH
jgi:hypothetical protein